jgi:hypothetical protein
MKRMRADDSSLPSTDLLRATLARLLSRYYDRPIVIEALVRAPSPYRSSFALEDLDVCLNGGIELALVFKNVGWSALPPDFRGGKPEFLYRATREISVYKRLLQHASLGTATCYGTLSDRRHARYWLFLERVPGLPLYAVGEFGVWQHVARWLAGMHARFAAQSGSLHRTSGVPLMRYDGVQYRRWIRRARPVLIAAAYARSKDDARCIDRLLDTYDHIIERLVALPVTLIHGEFYASNILAQTAADTVRVCPVDWEMAGMGPGLLDLAALIAGSWTEAQKEALAYAYFDASVNAGMSAFTPDIFRTALLCCRLHLAIQWLGWSPGWRPPPEHAHDWMYETLHLSRELHI